jgi:hypothetical protein
MLQLAGWREGTTAALDKRISISSSLIQEKAARGKFVLTLRESQAFESDANDPLRT